MKTPNLLTAKNGTGLALFEAMSNPSRLLPIILFTLVCSPAAVFAHEGGNHGGGGGNVCLTADRYKSLDEVEFPQDRIVDGSRGAKLAKGKSRNMKQLGRWSQVELKANLAWTRALAKINALNGGDEQLRMTLSKIAKRLEMMIAISGKFPTKPIRPSYISGACNDRNTVAALASNDRVIFVFEDVWNKLSVGSQEILLIHEILRVGQVKYRVINSDDSILEQATMAIFAGKKDIDTKYSLLSKQGATSAKDRRVRATRLKDEAFDQLSKSDSSNYESLAKTYIAASQLESEAHNAEVAEVLSPSPVDPQSLKQMLDDLLLTELFE